MNCRCLRHFPRRISKILEMLTSILLSFRTLYWPTTKISTHYFYGLEVRKIKYNILIYTKDYFNELLNKLILVSNIR